MKTKMKFETNPTKCRKKNVSVRRADENNIADVVNFFITSTEVEQTVAMREPNEIETWIRDGQVYIAQYDKQCVAFVRIVSLDTTYGLSDPVVKDFNHGVVTKIHEGSCKDSLKLSDFSISNVVKEIPVDSSASIYISGLYTAPMFRNSTATALLYGVVQQMMRSRLCDYQNKTCNCRGLIPATAGILFGTALNDKLVWRMACKLLLNEVQNVFGKHANANYITFPTSRPDGSKARGNFVYFQYSRVNCFQ